MNRDDIIRMARESGECQLSDRQFQLHGLEQITRFAAIVAAAEREKIEDEWSMCVQSDLEHGVKSLNEQAAKDWFKNYPEIAKFGAWLAARGNT